MEHPRVKDQRATWPQALATFLAPLLLILSTRWLVVEPFVIPSGSMIPTLLIHDHIFVSKFAYGVRIPFGKNFLFQWSHPEKGQVVVFRSPDQPEVFFVKRILATAGDEIAVDRGVVFVNGQSLEQILAKSPLGKSTSAFESEQDSEFEYWTEINLTQKRYSVRYLNRDLSRFKKTRVPEGFFFVMGDNRDQSNDSRSWGFVPEENAIGIAKRVWLACSETLSSAPFICAPQAIHWDRLWKKVE